MDSLDMQVLTAVRRWCSEGHRVALVTVARTWGSAPRPPGAWLALRDDGMVQGSVSGGCIEDDLITRMRDGRIIGTRPFALSYGVTKDEATRFGLPCGGTLELVIEPQPDLTALDAMASQLASGRLMLRTIDLQHGTVAYADGRRGDALTWNGQQLQTVHGPQFRLLIIGAGQISTYLAQMAMPLGYAVIVCDPRQEYQQEWRVPGTELRSDMPDDAVLALGLDPNSAVVALTHDPKLDDMALLEALKSPAFYVGALGSRSNNQKRRARLQEYFDISDAEIARLHGPVGLPIGSRTPPEIAISILAEMTACKYGAYEQRAPTSPDTAVSHSAMP